jgi:cytochrome c-type biogenesis protein CcmE
VDVNRTGVDADGLDPNAELGGSDGLNLTPRPTAPVNPRAKRRKWGAIAVLALVIVGGGVIVTQFLGSAIDYYCNVDDLGKKSGCDEGKRLRVQGEVVQGSLVEQANLTTFDIAFNGATLPVVLTGQQPGGVFQECIAVVVRGRLVDGTFEGNQVETKHDNTYTAANEGRVKAGESPACS